MDRSADQSHKRRVLEALFRFYGRYLALVQIIPLRKTTIFLGRSRKLSITKETNYVSVAWVTRAVQTQVHTTLSLSFCVCVCVCSFVFCCLQTGTLRCCSETCQTNDRPNFCASCACSSLFHLSCVTSLTPV